VGHYDGDELVVDTIGFNEKTFVDNYRTPHTDKMHVVERFKLLDGGKTLQDTIRVEDPWRFQIWLGRGCSVGIVPTAARSRNFSCAENNESFLQLRRPANPEGRETGFLSGDAASGKWCLQRLGSALR